MTNKDLDAMIAKADAILARMNAETREDLEREVDEAFTRKFGRTYRQDEPTPVDLPHAERNGDSSHKPPDTLAKLRRDYPSLFGTDADDHH